MPSPPCYDEEIPNDIMEMLNRYEFLSIKDREGGDGRRHKRVYCKFTHHELIPRKSDIEKHLRSSRFLKQKEWYSHDYSQYYPEHIVEHKDNRKMLYCRLTKSILMKKPSVVKSHINGKKFSASLKAYEEHRKKRQEKMVVHIEEDENVLNGHNHSEDEEEEERRTEDEAENPKEEVERSGGGNKRKIERHRSEKKKKKKKDSKMTSDLDATVKTAESKNIHNANDTTTTIVIDNAMWEAYKVKHTKSKILKAREERMIAKEFRMIQRKMEELKEKAELSDEKNSDVKLPQQ